MALGFEQSKHLKMDEPSPHIWSAPLETAAPSRKSPTPQEHVSQGEGHVKIMYSKDQVYQRDGEFSLEELRAQRYYKALSEKASNLNKMKEELRLQIEQKQRRLQQRTSSAPQIVPEEADTSAGPCESSTPVVKSAPIVIYSDQDEGPAVQRKSSVTAEEDMHDQSVAQQQRTAPVKPFSAPDDNRLNHRPSSSANRVSLKLPTSSVKGPRAKAELSADRDASLSRSEEAIINGHWNNSQCRSPDDTCEFARAARFASTPFGGIERQKPPGENPSRTAPEPTEAPSSEENKLSPILEISQEWGGTSFANFSQDTMKSRAVETTDTVLENVTESEDVCSPAVRSRLIQQADVTTFTNFHRKTGPLPHACGNNDLNLDGEMLYYRCKLGTLKDFSVYSSSSSTVLLKLDSSSVPWDFFLSSRLRARLSHDQQDGLVQISCCVYDDGCVTLWRIPQSDGVTIEDLLSEPVDHQGVWRSVRLLLELLRRFHSGQVVHGGLKPESLYFYNSLGAVIALDFSQAVDLQLQRDVKTARDLPSAQRFIQQGLLCASAAPHQVDLIGLAEITHLLLFNRPMRVRQENSAWCLDESSLSAPVRDFFHMILNPQQSSEQLLSDLISHVTSSVM